MQTKSETTNQAPRAVIQVDFAAKRRPSLHHLGRGVYAYPRACTHCGGLIPVTERKCLSCGATAPDLVFFERPYIGGVQTTRKLKSTTLRRAQIEVGRNRSEHALSKLGLAVDPYADNRVATVDKLADFYLESGCPQRKGTARAGRQLEEEKRRVEIIRRHLGKTPWTRINLEELADYHTKRLAEMHRGIGNRSVDMEEVTLSAILRCAVRHERKTGVDHNAIERGRPIHCQAETVRHCRDVMPANADELHQLARYLFDSRPSEVLGWQLLFEAFIGQRTSEILRLRADAKVESEPGFVQGNHLWLFRSPTSKGTFPYIEIHKALKDCLWAHRIWLQQRHPGSPWYFPSPCRADQPIRADALTRALRRVTAAMRLPHRTSHGLRSYYVNVLRSQGKLDAEIALRIGQKSGGRLIVQVYGEILPYKLTWLPSTADPAWSQWLKPSAPVADQLELGLLA